MKLWRRSTLPLFVWLVVMAAPALAHPLAPALLQLTETAPGHYDVLWRLSALQPTGTQPQPVLPKDCQQQTAPRSSLAARGAFEARWRVDCGADGLAGQDLAVNGLGGINAILRVRTADGRLVQGLVDVGAPRFTVPTPEQAAPVLPRYLAMGFEHLLSGPDHILFLLALILLVRSPRRLVATLTAFTLGHSLTLAAATLGLVRVNPALMELGIALSIVVAARELLAAKPSILGRHPATMAFSFGLLHGMGFAGALADVGLPPDAIPLALLAFNVGIELAQLALAAVFAWPLWRLHALASRPVFAAYAIGAMAALWSIERLGVLAAGTTAMRGWITG